MPESEATSLAALTEAVIAFRDARDWKQFHNAKDVAISLSLEASELLEIFQWSQVDDRGTFIEEQRSAIEDEVADIFYWLLLISNDWNIDLAAALRAKLQKNEMKYPADRAKGSSKKYNEN
jgi:NTP pyrophosphatase (non-canonical NTP hydrolase)